MTKAVTKKFDNAQGLAALGFTAAMLSALYGMNMELDRKTGPITITGPVAIDTSKIYNFYPLETDQGLVGVFSNTSMPEADVMTALLNLKEGQTYCGQTSDRIVGGVRVLDRLEIMAPGATCKPA